MRNPMFLFALILPVCFAFTTLKNDGARGGCPSPANVTLTAQFSGSATFDWDDCGCGGIYHVYYVKDGQTGTELVTGIPGITFSGLSAGTYRFYFYTVCGGEASAIIVEEIVIL